MRIIEAGADKAIFERNNNIAFFTAGEDLIVRTDGDKAPVTYRECFSKRQLSGEDTAVDIDRFHNTYLQQSACYHFETNEQESCFKIYIRSMVIRKRCRRDGCGARGKAMRITERVKMT